jgi:radical SAM protein with 4Fe4S-binding SPASM domain
MDGLLFEELKEKAIEEKIPIVGHFDLTYKCNLSCSHCYIVKNNRKELSTTEIKKVLDQLAKSGMLYLTFSGGEILLRNDFFEIASYARKLHFALRLLTNGILINDKMADKIASLSPELVAISIYSLNSKIHNEITGKNLSLSKSLYAINKLIERKIRVKISNVIMKQNFDGYPSLYQYAKEIGAIFQTDYRITPKSSGSKEPYKFIINDTQINYVLSDPILVKDFKQESQGSNTGKYNTIPCGAAHMSCYISPYGDIYPCVQLPIICGNLLEKKFDDIWNNSKELENIRFITISHLDQCSECNFFEYCRLCIGLNYVEKGNISSTSMRTCLEAQIMKRQNKQRR